MNGIQLPNNFDKLCNGTYTTKTGETTHIDIAALMKVVSEIPKMPKIFTMKIDIRRQPYLPENFILLSDSVADALEEAMRKAKCTATKPE